MHQFISVKSDNNLTKLLIKEINSNPVKIKFVNSTDFERDMLFLLELYLGFTDMKKA